MLLRCTLLAFVNPIDFAAKCFTVNVPMRERKDKSGITKFRVYIANTHFYYSY